MPSTQTPDERLRDKIAEDAARAQVHVTQDVSSSSQEGTPEQQPSPPQASARTPSEGLPSAKIQRQNDASDSDEGEKFVGKSGPPSATLREVDPTSDLHGLEAKGKGKGKSDTCNAKTSDPGPVPEVHSCNVAEIDNRAVRTDLSEKDEKGSNFAPEFHPSDAAEIDQRALPTSPHDLNLVTPTGREDSGRDIELGVTSSAPGAFPVGGINTMAGGSGDSYDNDEQQEQATGEIPIAAHLVEDENEEEEPQSLAMASKMDDVVINTRSRKVRIGIGILLVVVAAIVTGVVLGTQRATTQSVQGQCFVEDRTKLGNGVCDGGEYNTAECNWDGGDCVIYNKYPNCTIPIFLSSRLGDGVCDGGAYFTEECGMDDGDCADCSVTDPSLIGNGRCDGREYNTAECMWDGGDCFEFNSLYPDCNVPFPSLLSNGDCENSFGENSEECGWDGGDCIEFNTKYPNCEVIFPHLIGDGQCVDSELHDGTYTLPDGFDLGPYFASLIGFNTEECGWDGGDCLVLNKYPDCTAAMQADANVVSALSLETGQESLKSALGSGFEEFFGDLDFLGIAERYEQLFGKVGDGECDILYLNRECGFDDGDCEDLVNLMGITPTEDIPEEFFLKYPNCNVLYPERIGDGVCQGGMQNTPECLWDGGDCLEFNGNWPDCKALGGTPIVAPYEIGDGNCNGGDLNTEACGWDGGDCLEFNAKYPDCEVEKPWLVGNGRCDTSTEYGYYNTEECGWDGGDCL